MNITSPSLRWAKTLACLVFAVLAWAGGPAHAATPQQCQALTRQDFNAILDAPTTVLASTVIAANGPVPAYCRVEGYVAPAVGIEFHLPMDAWNGKFVLQGCGGMCGNFQGISSCAEAVTRGYACGTTDMGHRGTTQDGKWAYQNPIAEIDAGHRGTHVAAISGKAITEQFYGSGIKRSYFRGCSTGGRQALVEAERYPYDFDGIVGGAMVLYSPMGPPLQLFWDAQSNIGADGKEILSAAKMNMLHAASLNACDALDGLKDGVITDPRQCKFDPGSIVCKGGNGDSCLTDAEVTVARKFYEGPRNKKGLFPRVAGQLPGSEKGWAGFTGGKNGGSTGFANDILRYLAFPLDPGPSLDVTQFDWDRDPQRLSLSAFNAADPDLELFKASGGKMILFHGFADPSITALSSIRYFELMSRTMAGQAAAAQFSRFYLIPGMGHCLGGEGAAPAVDMLGAIDAWVENGQAPEVLTAYGMQNNTGVGPISAPAGFNGSNMQSLNPKISRPLYPYPDTYKYGSGDPNAASSFKRVKGAMK